MSADTIEINRAPVLTLWMAVVAERMGHTWGTALTIGKVFAGLNAQAKGTLIGIYAEPSGPSKKHGLGEKFWVLLPDGPRAVVKDKPVDPKSVETYLAKAFGESISAARETMERLAKIFTPEEIGPRAFSLYERFRPQIASGQRGWGQKGKLDLGAMRDMASKA